ncbi:MAG: phosphopentomutase [Tenericutes bacterium]|nr:phosphopentomutase [Mycoplasmatota bacterium]
MKFKRIFLMVLDSLGVGEALDANNYDDNGANTLGHIKDNYDLFVPNLKKLGFLNTINMDENNDVDAYYTIARPTNPGKDTLNGHYEIMGVKNDIQFKSFTTNGFPRELLDQIEFATGRKLLGNKNCIGKDIINELGERQIESNGLIIYTSNGSNLYISAHENNIPVAKLYDYAEKIRKITMREEWKVGRVVAKPFTGRPNNFRFTNENQVYAVKPPTMSVMNFLKENNYSVISIGKIDDVFDHEGITKTIKAKNNQEALNKLNDIMTKNFTGLCAVNLNDFDIEYGHKRDVEGYAKAIEELDVEIPMVLNKLETDDLLIITADHGCDPTFKGTEHTRENVPVIIYGRNLKEPKKLDILNSIADIGATIADNFEVNKPFIGKSFLDKLK